MEKPIKITKREVECLTWAAKGKTSFEIATILGLKQKTIDYYLSNACRKLNASNRRQAVAIAVKNELVSLP